MEIPSFLLIFSISLSFALRESISSYSYLFEIELSVLLFYDDFYLSFNNLPQLTNLLTEITSIDNSSAIILAHCLHFRLKSLFKII